MDKDFSPKIDASIIMPPQPRYLPGYTGYCPQKRFKCGRNFSQESHSYLTSGQIPYIKQTNTQFKNLHEDKTHLNNRNQHTDSLLSPPFIMKYCGFVPKAKSYVGTTETQARYMGFIDFVEEQKLMKQQLDELQQLTKQTQDAKLHLNPNFDCKALQKIRLNIMEPE